MEGSKTGISRRTALKRLGAGAAVAWSAPVLLSVESVASAGSSACSNCDCTCPRARNQCDPGCFCFVDASGACPTAGTPASNCQCIFANLCKQEVRTGCTRDADCAGMTVSGINGGKPFNGLCVHNCCGGASESTNTSCAVPCSLKPGNAQSAMFSIGLPNGYYRYEDGTCVWVWTGSGGKQIYTYPVTCPATGVQ